MLNRISLETATTLIVVALLTGCSADKPRDNPGQERLDAPRAQADDNLANAGSVDELLGAPRPKQPATSPSQDSGSVAASSRVWKDPAGRVLGTGEAVSLLDNNLCIETPRGLGALIPLDELCQADRDDVLSMFGPSRAGASAADIEDVAEDEILVESLDASGPLKAAPRDETASHATQRVVIPFDFVSRFDEGRYGQMVGDMLWKKLARERGIVIPDSMLDVRDMCKTVGVRPGPETSLEDMTRLVRDGFGADVGIWGSVERAPGHDYDVYDLTIRCVDFSAGGPHIIYETTNVRTEVVSEIPHLYVVAMLDKLFDRRAVEAMIDPIAEKNWLDGPNLVLGGDFQRGTGGVPFGWEATGGQQREPLGRLVQWVPEVNNPANKVIRFTFGPDVGDGFGVMYYSQAFPIDEGAKYRFQCRWRSTGPKVIIFIKCYDLMDSEYRPTSSSPAGGYVPDERQLRECYRAQMSLKGDPNVWHTHTEDFTPRHTKYTPRWAKVNFYSYLGGGVVEFDDVIVKQIVPASSSASRKDPRHSLESGVTLREMEENERRAREERQPPSP